MSPIERIRQFRLLLLIALVACAGCGTANTGTNDFDPDAGTHLQGWVVAEHVPAARADSNSCTECHGEAFDGGISGISCADCHLSGSPLVKTNCSSCHGNPPYGAAAPNRIGKHAAHSALPATVNMCDSCHSDAGSGRDKHFNGSLDVKLLSAYSAKSGTAAKNADNTCSNISCHGGQRTPAWYSGDTIDAGTQCSSCHAYGTSQYNSYASGRHNTHAEVYKFPCVRCHDVTKLQAEHFTRLDTTAVEGDPAKTIDDSLNYVSGTCLPACHNQRPW